MEERWLSVDEISQYIGVGKDTIYKLIETDGLPAYRIGKQWKFKKAAVDEWVVSHGDQCKSGKSQKR